MDAPFKRLFMRLDSMNGQEQHGKSVQESIANECIALLWNKERSRANTSKQMRIRAKGRKLILWIALAMDVTTRLWLAGVVSQHRDHTLIDRLFQHVRACCQCMHALLVCTDGFAAYPT